MPPKWLTAAVLSWPPWLRFVLMPIWMPLAAWWMSMLCAICGAIYFGVMASLQSRSLLPEMDWWSIVSVSSILTFLPIIVTVQLMMVQLIIACIASAVSGSGTDPGAMTLKQLFSRNSADPWRLL